MVIEYQDRVRLHWPDHCLRLVTGCNNALFEAVTDVHAGLGRESAGANWWVPPYPGVPFFITI